MAGEGSASVAIFFAILSVTELISSPIAGWICDRYNRPVVFIIADLLRSLAAIVVAMSLDHAGTRWTIWIAAIWFAACDRAALTASQSMIPSVGRHHTPIAANSTVLFVTQGGGLTAALVIGTILDSSTFAVAFLSMAGAFAISAIGMSFVRLTTDRTCVSLRTPHSIGLIHSTLSAATFAYALLYAGGVLITIIGPAFVFEELGGTAIDFGWFESAWSLGTILGAIAIAKVFKLATAPTLNIMTVALSACSFVALAMTGLPSALLAVGIAGAAHNVGRVVVEITLQANVPSAALGRAKGALHSIAVLSGLALMTVITVFSGVIDPSRAFAVYACLLALGAIFLMVWSNRSPRP